jgi:hypothetical protein
MLTLNIKNLHVSMFVAPPLVLPAAPANDPVPTAGCSNPVPKPRGVSGGTTFEGFTKLDTQFAELPHDAASWPYTRDNRTGLIWTSGNVGGGRMTWAEAEKTAAAVGEGFRLPTVDELQTLVDRTKYNPALRGAEFFIGPESSYYWTSSPDASDPDCAWVVHFNDGYVLLGYRSSPAFVRAVRGPVAASQ